MRDREFQRPDTGAAEKAKACNTPEEMLELAKEEGLELTDEQLEGMLAEARRREKGVA